MHLLRLRLGSCKLSSQSTKNYSCGTPRKLISAEHMQLTTLSQSNSALLDHYLVRRSNQTEASSEFIDALKTPNRIISKKNQELNRLVKANKVNNALQFFQQMKQDNLCDSSSYNTLMSMYIASPRRIEELLDEMTKSGITPNFITYSTLINSYGKRSDEKNMWRWYEEMKKRKLDPSRGTFHTLMYPLARLGNTEKVLELYHDMVSRGLRPDACTFNAICLSLAKVGQVQDVLDWMKRMEDSGVKADAKLMNTVIHAVGRSGDLDGMLKLFNSATEKVNFLPDGPMYNTIIDAFGKAGQTDQMMKWYYKMEKSGVPASFVTYTSMLAAFAKKNDFKKMVEIFNLQTSKGIPHTAEDFNVIISVLAKTGMKTQMMEWFEQMKAAGLQPDVVTYNSMLYLHLLEENSKEVLNLVNEMRESGLQLDSATYCMLVGHFSRLGDFKQMEFWFSKARDAAALQTKTYNWILAVRSRTDPHGTVQLFEEMKKYKVQPDSNAFSAVISSLVKHGDLKTARHYYVLMIQSKVPNNLPLYVKNQLKNMTAK